MGFRQNNEMQIIANLDRVDVTKLRDRELEDAPFSFPFALEHDGLFYPHEDWWDFGVVLLGWWSWELLALLQHSRVKRFLFMKGPYEVQVRHRRSTHLMEMYPLGLDVIWKVDPNELTA